MITPHNDLIDFENCSACPIKKFWSHVITHPEAIFRPFKICIDCKYIEREKMNCINYTINKQRFANRHE